MVSFNSYLTHGVYSVQQKVSPKVFLGTKIFECAKITRWSHKNSITLQ